MANLLTNTSELTSIADAIRSKTGKSSSISFPSGFISEIESISGGGDWEDITSSLTVGDYINVDYIKCYYNSNMNLGWLFAKNLKANDELPSHESPGDLEIDPNFTPNWEAIPNSLDFIIMDADEFYGITTTGIDVSDSGAGILIPGSYIASNTYTSTYTFGIWPI